MSKKDDFENAADAFEREDYETAYKLFLPLAEQGDADAQYNLGVMYNEGEGVPQDYKEATKWFRLAAEEPLNKNRKVSASKNVSGLVFIKLI